MSIRKYKTFHKELLDRVGAKELHGAELGFRRNRKNCFTPRMVHSGEKAALFIRPNFQAFSRGDENV
jgi:hypothetical protein